MMRPISRLMLIVILASAWSPIPAMAFFDAQVLYGVRNNKIKSTAAGSSTETINSNEMEAAVHLSPIPLVPVGFGLAASMVNFPKDKTSFPFKDFQGMEGAFEVSAWSPIDLLGVTPYAKLDYILYGKYGYDSTDTSTGTAINTKAAYNVSGNGFAIGLKWSLLPLIGILVEYNSRQTTLKADSVKIDGVEATTKPDVKASHTALQLGVQVGF